MTDADAWTDFWSGDSGAGSGGCLPQRWAIIEQAQQDVWRRFASGLPHGARVLDLATGDGRVLGWMKAGRDDLDLQGIDLAPQLPSPPAGTQTRGGVAMEALPYAPGDFAAVVSQFGFEYGSVADVAAEIARVVVPGGIVGLLVHRGDGPILEHNLQRRAAIDWVLQEQKLVEGLTAALVAPNGGPGVAAQVAGAVGLIGARKFGEDSPAWEIPEAMRRTILLGQQSAPAEIITTFGEIERRAQNEIGRITSLQRACATADQRDTIASAFAAQGFTLGADEDVCEPAGRAIATFLTFN